MTSVLARGRKSSDTSISVKYTPCAKTEPSEDDDLEEIAIVSGNNEKRSLHDQNSANQRNDGHEPGPVITANGPRIISTLGPFQSPSDRTKLIGERLSSSGTGVINISSPVYSGKVVEQKSKSTSKQSLLEIVSTKLDSVKHRGRHSRDDHILMNKTRSSETVTSKGIRKIRRKEITEKFGKKNQRFDLDTSVTSTEKDGCKWTFVFDPSGRLCYWWSAVVGIAFLYNFWVIIYRFAFQEIDSSNIGMWFTLDYSADLLYILDIAFHFRTGYLDEGVLQTDSTKLRVHYMNSAMFYIDCLCLLPLDFLYLSIGFYSLLRGFRLVKVYRFWAFLDRTERHTNFPNFIRTCSLLHYLLALFHWNACLYKIVLRNNNSTTWSFPEDDIVLKQYLHALYWSTLTFTNVGGLPTPQSIEDYLFVVFELICGLLLFATVLGHIANIVASVSAARKEFQARLDGVKTYMSLRRVPLRLQDRVIKWFDYLWMSNKSADEEKTLSLLPDKLKAEIAIHVHLDTLKRVEIFQRTEAGFLCELVLRLRPVLFSPGDYICRKGEVGKDMYIVNRGRLHVVADNGKTVLATLKPGSYFGEISILNMGTAGNRRTASVKSVGYSDLFCLSKQDLWDVLKEYPAARVNLEAIAVKRLARYKKQPLEKAAISRSKSTPGLVESAGKIPLEAMFIPRHHTLPAGMIHQIRPSRPSPSCSEVSIRPSRVSHASHPGIILQTTSEPTLLAVDDFDQVAIKVITSTTSTAESSGTDSTMPRSPLPGERPGVSFTPPASPRRPMPANISATNILNISATLPSTLPGYDPRMSPSHIPAGTGYQPTIANHLTHYSPTPTHLTPYGTPYCVASYPPSPNYLTGSTTFASLGNPQMQHLAAPVPAHMTMQPHVGYQQQQPQHLSGSVTPVSPPRDPSHDILLQEITRLRERLVTLETENASMSFKLNQQQWEVQHRLAEIEMHICGSESPGSTASGEDRTKCDPTNKESVI